jgi:hypothetical protein
LCHCFANWVLPQLRSLTPKAYGSDHLPRLVTFTKDELAGAFDRIDELRQSFPVNNPRASIADMKRHLYGEPELVAHVAPLDPGFIDIRGGGSSPC